MDAVPLGAQKVLDTFFSSAPGVRHPSIRGRAPLTQSLIEAHLEANGEAYLDAHETALLAAERQLEPRGAVLRTMSTRAMLAALPSFLTRSLWPRDVRDASACIQIVGALRHWVVTADPTYADPAVLGRLDLALARANDRLGRLRGLDAAH